MGPMQPAVLAAYNSLLFANRHQFVQDEGASNTHQGSVREVLASSAD